MANIIKTPLDPEVLRGITALNVFRRPWRKTTCDWREGFKLRWQAKHLAQPQNPLSRLE